jgi:hypothetical protein
MTWKIFMQAPWNNIERGAAGVNQDEYGDKIRNLVGDRQNLAFVSRRGGQIRRQTKSGR